MADCLSWVHFGDLHVDEADGYEGTERFTVLTAIAQRHLRDGVAFAFLPGDNANHGTADQYRQIGTAMAGLDLPWHVIPGDHDFEPGDLDALRAVASRQAPYAVTIEGYRCLFLDIVSAGDGGPNFRIDPAQRGWLERELAVATAADVRSVVFMHAYPGDLKDDPDGIAALFAAHHVAFVDTGHTHYNELLNDGRVVYGATRSTGQTEEGPPGFTVVTLDDGVPSWRFQPIDGAWPLVQIISPADRRLVTDPADPRQVPTGDVAVRAKVFGRHGTATVAVDDGVPTTMTRAADGVWAALLAAVPDGLHRITVAADGRCDVIETLVRSPASTPKRAAPVALGRDAHAVGAWPQAGILGSQLGPNKNGAGW